MPPKDLQFGSGGDYIETGRATVNVLKKIAGLQPHEDVLDIGCASGRVAVALTEYLGSGTYEGFDVVAEAVSWCQENITPRFPNFGFRFVDVASSQYRPDGAGSASELTFPYPDERFDLVFLLSVFTHLVQNAAERYLSEIHRVLRPGGRMFATFLLLTDESLPLVQGKTTQPHIPHGEALVLSENKPEMAVAYPQDYLLDALRERRFAVRALTHGTWFQHDHPSQGGQDWILAYKE